MGVAKGNCKEELQKRSIKRSCKKETQKEAKRGSAGKCEENDKEIRVGERKEICVLEPIYRLSRSYHPNQLFPFFFS